MNMIKRMVGVAAVLSLGTVGVMASGNPQNLNTTNYISSAVALVQGYPTNSINGTNGIGMQTGNAAYIGDVKEFGIEVSGFLRNTGSAAFLDTAWVGAMSSGSPSVTAGTNLTTFGNTVLTSNPYNEGTNGFVRIIIPIPPTLTNWFTWHTNIVNTHPLAQDNWVGLFGISNNLASSCWLTNFQVRVNRKIIPVALTGN